MDPPSAVISRALAESGSQCIVCRKSIPPGALKCTECGSQQNKYAYYLENTANLLKPILELAPIVGIAVSL